MIDKSKILKRTSGDEERILLSRVLDRAIKSFETGTCIFTDFLDPYQRSIVDKSLKDNSEISYRFFGGYEGAEREIAMFCPVGVPEDDYPLKEFPLKVIEVTLNSREILSHRDYLGSLMGLGLKREKTGDILVRDDGAKMVVHDDIAEFIKLNLFKVSNAEVSVEIKTLDDIGVREQKTREIKGTVASLRVDSVASIAYGLSRSKMAEFIKAGKLNLNWENIESTTRQVKEGDTLSIRGKGRVEVEKVGHLTKKGRISIILKKYI